MSDVETLGVDPSDAQAKLERANALLQLVLEQLPAIYWVVDRDLRITHAGGAIRDLLGYTEGRVVGTSLKEARTTESSSVDPVPYHQRALGGEIATWDTEYRGRCFTNVLTPERNNNGEIVGAIGTCVDVTDARAFERRARDALKIGRMGYLDWNLVTNEIEWSPETYRLFGYVPGEFMPTLEATVGMVPVEERDYVRQRLDAAIAGPAEYNVIHRMVRADGEVIHVHAHGKVTRDASGKALRMLGTVVDVTELKRTEDALRVKKQRLRQALHAASATTWDLDLRTGDVSRRPRGDGRDESTTLDTWRTTLHPDDRGAVDAALRDAIAGRTPEYRAEFRTNDPVEGERWGLAFGQVERAPDGTPVRLIGLTIDITERKRAELELLDVDRRRSDFIAVLSHELRNPLASIRSSVHLLQRADSNTADARRAKAIIGRQSRHLVRMVDDLLDVTRINSGKIQVQRSRLDFVELTRLAINDHLAFVGARTLDVDLPEVGIWLDADATRMAQVLGNLISNAIKFTSEGGTIAVKLGVVHDTMVLEVADDGVGIDKVTLAQLFKPFMQADRSLDRSRGGLGLGLALVKALVEMHGGSVSVWSDGPGRGARFTVQIPVRDPASASLEAQPKPVVHRPRRILVIEDNVDTAVAMARVLTLWKHQVAIAYNGEVGLETAREFAPDVILCDLGLPGKLDGYAVARTLQHDPELAAAYRVALTGYVQPEDRRKAREAGFHVHMAKPVDLEMFQRLLAELPDRTER